MSTPISGPGCPPPVHGDVANAVLEGIVVAMAAHPTQTEARRQVKTQGARAFIMGLLPQNALQMMIAGQAALFHELIADAGHDVLAAMSGPGKERARGSVNAMSRTLCKNLEMLVRLQGVPEPAAVVREEPAHAAPVVEAAPPPSMEQPVAEFSWLDEPYEEWVIVTPADIAAMKAAALADKALADKALARKALADKVPEDAALTVAAPENEALAEAADAVLVPTTAVSWRTGGDGDGIVPFHGAAAFGPDMSRIDPETMARGPRAVAHAEGHDRAAR